MPGPAAAELKHRAPLAVQYRRIEASPGWQVIDWRELFRYRDLFTLLVLRDISILYKQTVLGYAWAIVRPVFQMLVFTVVFGTMAKVSSDGIPYPIFSYAALVPWTYFASALTASTNSVVTNASLISKVYFPRLVLPLTPVLAKLVDFVIAFAILGILMVWYRITPSWNLLYLPLLILLMALTAAGMGMWLSALTIQYRDVKHASEFLSQLLLFAAPVVWPASLIAERFGPTAYLLYGLYPMAGVIEGFRACVIGLKPMPWDLIMMGSLSGAALFVTGAFSFKRLERRFEDVA